MPKSNTPRVLVDSQGREFPASIIDKELVRRLRYRLTLIYDQQFLAFTESQI